MVFVDNYFISEVGAVQILVRTEVINTTYGWVQKIWLKLKIEFMCSYVFESVQKQQLKLVCCKL